MLNQITKLDAINGKLPKKSFQKARVYHIRDKIDLYYFLAWFDSKDFYQEDNQFRHREHHSIVVSKGKRYARDFNNSRTYDFYSFCKDFLGLGFYSSVYLGNMFMNESLGYNNFSKNAPRTSFDTLQDQIDKGLYFKSKNFSQSWAYLCNTRKIERDVINYCYNSDLLYLQKYGNSVNVCFAFSDKDDYINGFEILGCLSDVRYKSVVSTESDSYFIYKKYYDSESENTKLLVFESVIDLLSFSSLMERKQIEMDVESLLLVSMRGLNKGIMYKSANDYGIPFNNIYSCTDNDVPSFNFISNYEKYNEDFGAPAQFLNYEEVKDWNDLLIKGFDKIIKVSTLFKSQLPGFESW